MPQGNHHMTPSGNWVHDPTTSSIPKLMWITARRVAGMAAIIAALVGFRSLSYKYTYTNFLGKTMSLGTITTATHEPLSVEEVDKLKAAEAEKKRIARLCN